MSRANKWVHDLPMIPDPTGLYAVLSRLGVTPAPGYKIVREGQYHWQFDCQYGAAPVDCCVYTGDDGDAVDGYTPGRAIYCCG